MSNIIDVTPKTDKEMSNIYQSITQSLNGLTVGEATSILDRIRLRLRINPVVNFSPLDHYLGYDPELYPDSEHSGTLT